MYKKLTCKRINIIFISYKIILFIILFVSDYSVLHFTFKLLRFLRCIQFRKHISTTQHFLHILLLRKKRDTTQKTRFTYYSTNRSDVGASYNKESDIRVVIRKTAAFRLPDTFPPRKEVWRSVFHPIPHISTAFLFFRFYSFMLG